MQLQNSKTKKRVIILSIVVVLAAAIITGIYFVVHIQNDAKSVEIIPVMNITPATGTMKSIHRAPPSAIISSKFIPIPPRSSAKSLWKRVTPSQ